MPGPGPSLLADERAISLERPVVWLVVLVAVAAIVGSVVVLSEDVRRDAPDTEFAVSFDGETRTVMVEHAGGDTITDRVTEELAVVVVDQSAGTSSRVVWASDSDGPTKRGMGYPVEQGDALTIDDPTVDADGDENFHDADASVGFQLESGDTVRVVWTGSRHGGPAQNVTLADATIGS